MSEKIMANDVYCYTLADLEQARKQGAEDERVRCIFQFDKLYESIESSNDSARFDRMDTLIKCVNAVRALGPIGETREETERRVRRETVEVARKALHELDTWTPGTIDRTLDAIAEGKA